MVLLPAFNDELVLFTANSLVALAAIYYGVQYYLGLKGKHQTDREKSWVLTAISSAIMTACSVPYIWSWFVSGRIFEGGHWADKSCCFFVAYLLCDLIIGSMHYRSSINLLTGWIHHTIYILLLTLLVLPHSFSSFFNMCCILELPTLLLSLGSLNKNLRNDYLFASVFFATRICLHMYIALWCTLEAFRESTVNGPGDGGPRSISDKTWIPPTALTVIFPMHAMWMKDCVRGILRRRKLTSTSASLSVSSIPPLIEPSRVRDIPAYILARSSRRTATLLRRSRVHVVRMLCEVLDEGEGKTTHTPHSHTPHSQSSHTPPGHQHSHTHTHTTPSDSDTTSTLYSAAPRWRSIRRRVVGRLRMSLPEVEWDVHPSTSGGVPLSTTVDD
ncbi:hypothetical protein BDY19DRAFT_525593 [Irpex rosettiformis]|uniref:Uncharacterized protein n=1 Tax=Irpex rosettiformis TaxID=378272 RepID=A0ACB8TR38_9APHY|nr:hypothetical protein BDY19DRAFT_525593 [Irpex rosettiformis]